MIEKYSWIKRNCRSIEYMRFKILELKINKLETLFNLKDTKIRSINWKDYDDLFNSITYETVWI